MSATDPTPVPIYERLIAERGDTVAAAARTAEQTVRQAADALDFSRSATDFSEDPEIEVGQPDTDFRRDAGPAWLGQGPAGPARAIGSREK